MNNKVSLKKHLVLFLLLGCNTVAFSQLGTGISARKKYRRPDTTKSREKLAFLSC